MPRQAESNEDELHYLRDYLWTKDLSEHFPERFYQDKRFTRLMQEAAALARMILRLNDGPGHPALPRVHYVVLCDDDEELQQAGEGLARIVMALCGQRSYSLAMLAAGTFFTRARQLQNFMAETDRKAVVVKGLTQQVQLEQDKKPGDEKQEIVEAPMSLTLGEYLKHETRHKIFFLLVPQASENLVDKIASHREGSYALRKIRIAAPPPELVAQHGQRYAQQILHTTLTRPLQRALPLMLRESSGGESLASAEVLLEQAVWDREEKTADAPLTLREIRQAGAMGGESDPEVELENLAGLDGIKQQIREIVAYLRFQRLRQQAGQSLCPVTLHMAFSGNPGTGKTIVARLVGRILKKHGLLTSGKFHEVGRDALIGRYVGHTAQMVKARMSEARGSVLFIDEAYALAYGGQHDYGAEALAVMVAEMENFRDEICVIMAGYQAEMGLLFSANPGLRSRVSYHIRFPDYTPDQLVEIFAVMAREDGYKLDGAAAQIAKDWLTSQKSHGLATWGNGRGARNLFERSKIKHAIRLMATASPERGMSRITGADVLAAAAELTAPAGETDLRIGFAGSAGE